MEMRRNSVKPAMDGRLRRHTDGIRENQISVALIMLYLQGYQVELNYVGEPVVDCAREVFDELTNEQKIALWSCSPRGGGVWTTEQRRLLKE